MALFTMPSLGADMEAGTVSRWLVRPGDDVQRGDVVAVVDTDKSTIEVEIFVSGRVEELLVPEGQRVAVGTPLARVSAAGGEAPASADRAPVAVGAGVAVAAAGREPAATLSPVVRHLAERLGVDVAHLAGTGAGGRVTRADVEQAAAAGPARTTGAVPAGSAAVRASPLARRLAAAAGVPLEDLAPGSGPAGAVLEADVRRATAAAPPPARREGSSDRDAAMRRAIGDLMARSKREIPHYYLSTTVDLARSTSWLAETNAERPLADRLVLAVLLIKATARAVSAVPEMNGFMIDGEFQASAAVHVGVAVSRRGGGVVAPAIHDVAGLTLDELMARLHDLVDRARHGALRSSEVSDPTITVTNLGELGVESVFGVIYPPQVALVGFGRRRDVPWAENGMVGIRPALTATLSGDHRVSDGHRGGLFLATVANLLQKPEEL